MSIGRLNPPTVSVLYVAGTRGSKEPDVWRLAYEVLEAAAFNWGKDGSLLAEKTKGEVLPSPLIGDAFEPVCPLGEQGIGLRQLTLS
jgi:hypothetical protein